MRVTSTDFIPAAARQHVSGVPDTQRGLPACPEGLPERGREGHQERVQLHLLHTLFDAREE